jgi:putative ABC transport system permease protein
MIKHIFLLSFRNFFKNKIYTITILLSLAIGFSIANILIGFSFQEINTDSQYTNKDRIYRLISEDPFGREGMISYMESSIPQYLKDNYPEIETSTILNTLRNNGIFHEGNAEAIRNLTLLRTDSEFLRIFDFHLSEGDPYYAIGPKNIVITKALSKILFSDYSSLGQEVNLAIDTTTIPLNISGVIKKSIENSHLTFDALVFADDYVKARGGICYILLHHDIDPDQFEVKINEDSSMPSLIGPGKINYHLQPIREVYFDEENSRNFSKARNKLFIWISWAITIAVLFLAGFNFLNLFFNAFLKRWKEFGMKKVLGASIHTFLITAIIEVAVYIVVSFGLSLLITVSVLPWFNSLLNAELSFKYYSDLRIILFTSILILIIAALVILRLTRYMYRINPVSIINNRAQFKISLNRYMLGIQFVTSFILLICSITILRQTNYIKNKPLGFNRNILEVRAPVGSDAGKLQVFQNHINTLPGTSLSSICSGNPISDNMILRYDLDEEEFYTPYLFVGDENYLNTLGLTLSTGEIPSTGNSSAKLINEAFVRYFDMANPIGEKIPGTKEDYIAGVVKNFNVASLNQDIPPVIISINKSGDSFHANTLLAKIDLMQLGDILSEFERYWKEVYPSYPFKYLLMRDELIRKHKNDLVFSKIITASALLSILITCFGLFALSWGTTQERSKEIGIRKVNGATSLNILYLLLTNYLKIILITSAIGIPLSIILMNKWLEKFAFRIDIGVAPLVYTGGLLMAIALVTVGYHTVKSSFQNPVESLRYE